METDGMYSNTHSILTRMIKFMKIWLKLQGLNQILQKLPLECDNFMDIPEESIDFSIR